MASRQVAVARNNCFSFGGAGFHRVPSEGRNNRAPPGRPFNLSWTFSPPNTTQLFCCQPLSPPLCVAAMDLPFDFFCSELNTGEPQRQLQAVSRMRVICLALGPERTRKHLLTFLQGEMVSCSSARAASRAAGSYQPIRPRHSAAAPPTARQRPRFPAPCAASPGGAPAACAAAAQPAAQPAPQPSRAP